MLTPLRPDQDMRADELVKSGWLKECNELEHSPEGPFVWTRGRFRLHAPPARFATLTLGYLGEHGTLRIQADGTVIDQCDLRHGWQRCTLGMPSSPCWLDCDIDPVIAVETDTRELGIMLRVLTPHELSPAENAALANAQYQAGATYLRSRPAMLTIETTSRCNLRCVMCEHAIGEVHRPKHLDNGLAEKIRRFLQHASAAQLHGIGEPTNSPVFWRMLDDLPPPEICESSINTNFTVVDERRLNALLDSKLKIINVSLDAAAEITYRRIRGFPFKTVVGNIERLITVRRERRQVLPHVYINMTLMRSNIEEVCDFVRLGARLGVDLVKFYQMNRWPDDQMTRYVVHRDGWTFDYTKEGLWNCPTLSNRCVRDAIALAKELGVSLYLDHNKDIFLDECEPSTETVKDCRYPWMWMMLNSDGRVRPCCFATKALGNLNDTSAASIWNGKIARELRSYVKDDRIHPVCSGAVCKYVQNSIARNASDSQ